MRAWFIKHLFVSQDTKNTMALTHLQCLTFGVIFVVLVVTWFSQRDNERFLVTTRTGDEAAGDFWMSPFLQRNMSEIDALRDDITVVTAFMDVGGFNKGAKWRSIANYSTWMKSFRLIKNPLIAFMDSQENAESMRRIRQELPAYMTKVVVIQRSDLWTFGLLPMVEKILSQEGYPQFHPNTVVPEFACAVNAKYELLLTATKKNPYQTRYLAWLDIGYFRHLVESDEKFHLTLPPDFDPTTVAYTQVNERDPSLSTEAIITGNRDWVAGGFVLASVPVMEQWAWQYRASLEKMMNENMIGADQQVIYDMVNNRNPVVNIQPYHTTGNKYRRWFYLGYVCQQFEE